MQKKYLFPFLSVLLTIIILPSVHTHADYIPTEAKIFHLTLLQEGELPDITPIPEEDLPLCETIRTALLQKEEKISVYYPEKSNQKLVKLYENLINNSPMLYDVLGTVSIYQKTNDKYVIYPQYKSDTINGSALFSSRASSNAVTEAVNDILNQVTNEMSDVEKMLAVHDYILTHYEYDLTYSYYYADDFFTHKRGVCNAYALAFKHIMDLLEIPCTTVISREMNHVWNMVNTNGKWYHIDVTWDDPINDSYGQAYHNYFMLSDEAIGNAEHDHYSWSASYKATDTSYDNYYWINTRSPLQYYQKRWYGINYENNVFSFSVKDNKVTEYNSKNWYQAQNIYDGTMYLLDQEFYLYKISFPELDSFEPVLIARFSDAAANELNGLYMEDGYFKYACANEKYYLLDDNDTALYHNYYTYRTFFLLI